MGDALHGLLQSLRALDDLADLVFEDLRVKQLLGVFPFVERLRLVQSLVALEPDELQPERARENFSELGLAHAGRSLDENGLAHRAGEINHRGHLAAADVPLSRETLHNLVRRLKHESSV